MRDPIGGGEAGHTHRKPEERLPYVMLPTDTDDEPKTHSIASTCDTPPTLTVTTVPPAIGPSHGSTPDTTIVSSSSWTPLDVYSRPLVLTSTAA